MTNQKQNLAAKANNPDVLMLGLTLALAVIYFIYSKSSDGFYQHDEAAHYINMRQFWSDPFSILGNWPKPGYKLLYVIPALFGEQFVQFFNCLVAAFSCFMAYKLTQKYKSDNGYIAFILLATQPLWVQLSFRNYTEAITGLLAIAATYFHENKKTWIAALILSYATLIRQEFYLFIGLYGLYLLYQKDWKAIAFSLIPQLFITIYSFFEDGSLLYIWNSVIGTSEAYGGRHPRLGFDHYFNTSIVIFGALTVVLSATYLLIKLNERKNWRPFLIIPPFIFFLMHCIFNLQAYGIGPASGGNLRYITISSPGLAVVAALAIHDFKKLEKKNLIFIGQAVLLILIGIYLTYEHNNVVLSEVRNWKPLIFSLATVFLLAISVKSLSSFYHNLIFTGLAGIMIFSSIKPIKADPEVTTMKKVAEWYETAIDKKMEGGLFDDSSRLTCEHSLFFYFTGKSRNDFKKWPLKAHKTAYDTCEVGTIIIWDAHYSKKRHYGDFVDASYLEERPFQFQFIRSFPSESWFHVKIFKKIAPMDTHYEEGLRLLNAKEYDSSLVALDASIENNSKNYSAYMQRGKVYQNQQKYQDAFEDYNKALELNPNFSKGYQTRASLFSAFSRIEEAEKDFSKSIQSDPRNFEAYFYRGNMYLNQKNYQKASQDFVKVLQINGRIGGAYHQLGICAINMNQKNQACQYFQNAVKLGYQQSNKAIQQYCQ